MKRFLRNRLLPLLLCAALLVSLAACGAPRNEEETTMLEETTAAPEAPAGSVSVPYLPSDSLNPFYMETVVNAALVSLYCRSLYYLDNGYNAIADLAQSETVSVENVKVNLLPGLIFSDGTPLTAKDVVYSFEKAEQSGLYGDHLKNIADCTAPDDATVLFSLNHPDVNVRNDLIFPIVKSGTADKKDAQPVSCGHYRFTQDGIRLSLTCNRAYQGDPPPVSIVRLTEVTDNTVLETLVDGGEVTFCYSDLSHGSAKRTYAAATDIYLNNLVFLGVNGSDVNFGIPDMRRALSVALDRQEIVSAGFQNFARAAVLPFNTSWSALADSPIAAEQSFRGDLEAADGIMAPYGAGEGRQECFVRLLCPESNSFLRNTAGVIAKQLAKLNITVTVENVNKYEYYAALESRDYQLYLGEIKLTPDMDLAPFLLYGAASYGIDADESGLSETYYRYRGGEISLEEFLEAFVADTPFVPLCFRNGRMCYSSDVAAVSGVSEFRLFGDIDKWEINAEHEQG
ncbi:MAG: ABC transporter substrate-binding protein [Clostridia bacterium]|nr:ABC transporter substrate-binding protein [Clostridia bacterium]